MIAIFDFDGTIADTIPASIFILNKLADHYLHKTFDEKLIRKFRDMPIPEIFKELNIPIVKLPLIARKARRELNKEIENLKPIKGIKNLLIRLRSEKFSLGIVSSNNKDSIKIFLSKNGLEFFDFIYTNSRIFGKANTLKKVISKNKLEKGNIIYIGDEIRDIDAARKVGIKIISVIWGVNSAEKLSSRHPDFLVKSPRELFNLLISIQ